MSKLYRLAVFDVDGTLLDTSEGIYESVLHTIKVFDLPQPTDEQLASFIGPPVQDSFRNVYGIEGSRLQEMANVFRAQYSGADLMKAMPYEGILGVFRKLAAKGMQIAVATYKRQDYAVRIVKHFGFGDFTSVIYGADNENKLSKADIIKRCLQDTGTGPEDAVMVGDTDKDAFAAQEIGMDFVAVTYGYGFSRAEECEISGCIGVASTPEEILKFL